MTYCYQFEIGMCQMPTILRCQMRRETCVCVSAPRQHVNCMYGVCVCMYWANANFYALNYCLILLHWTSQDIAVIGSEFDDSTLSVCFIRTNFIYFFLVFKWKWNHFSPDNVCNNKRYYSMNHFSIDWILFNESFTLSHCNQNRNSQWKRATQSCIMYNAADKQLNIEHWMKK